MSTDEFKKTFTADMWPGGFPETKSGIGSTLKYTEMFRENLQEFLDKHKIKSIVDAPCGDFNWMKSVDLTGIDYFGADIQEDIIKENIEKYGSKTCKFAVMNIIDDALPPADLFLVRDVLIHIKFDHIKKLLHNIANSKFKWLLISCHKNKVNKDISKIGGARWVNLNAPPFNFPKLSDENIIPDWAPGFAERYMLAIEDWRLREFVAKIS